MVQKVLLRTRMSTRELETSQAGVLFRGVVYGVVMMNNERLAISTSGLIILIVLATHKLIASIHI